MTLPKTGQTQFDIGGGLPLQDNYSDCSRVTQHALCFGSCGHVKQDPYVPAQSANSDFQSDLSHESVKPKSACQVPRVSIIKDQGHQFDFRAPPIKSIADFLLYLFQDRKLQPSTIDGYRSARKGSI